MGVRGGPGSKAVLKIWKLKRFKDFFEPPAPLTWLQKIFSGGFVWAEKIKILIFDFSELNSDIEVIAYNLAFDSRSAMEIISQYDLVLDCTDNVATRYFLLLQVK